MAHIESVEPRQLFASFTSDTSLAGDGSLALPRGFGNNVLATHGAIYVSGFHQVRHAFFIYKYNEQGQLDESWGNGGSMRPTILSRVMNDDVVPQMTFDARTGGLLLTVDGGRTVSIERLDSFGRDDLSWGRAGVFEYSVRNIKLKVGEVLPLARKTLAFAFTSTEQAGTTFDGFKTDGGAANLSVAKLDRSGRFDKSFNGGAPRAVVLGHVKKTEYGDNDSGSEVVSRNQPIFGDLAETSTGFRVVDLREKTEATYYVYDFRQGSNKSGRTDWIVDTIDLTADGIATTTYNTRINRDDNDPDYFPNPPVIDGNSVSVLGTTIRTDQLSETLTRIRLINGGIASSGTIGGGTESLYDFKYYRNAYGLTLGLVSKSDSTYFVRLYKDLSMRKRYDPQNRSTFPLGGYSINTVDDSGRLVAIDGSASGAKTLRRLT